MELCASSAAAFFAVLVFSSCSTGENSFFVLARYTEATPRRVLISLAGAAVRKAGDRRVDIVPYRTRLGAAARTLCPYYTVGIARHPGIVPSPVEAHTSLKPPLPEISSLDCFRQVEICEVC